MAGHGGSRSAGADVVVPITDDGADDVEDDEDDGGTGAGAWLSGGGRGETWTPAQLGLPHSSRGGAAASSRGRGRGRGGGGGSGVGGGGRPSADAAGAGGGGAAAVECGPDDYAQLDPATCNTWEWPTSDDYADREYQLEITAAALFQNTLVSLPTGMGKTFIAAVVMHNYYRFGWRW